MTAGATDRLAVLSDIHGNRWALRAVLLDIDRRGIGCIVHLRDCAYGPCDPAGTVALLMERGISGVRGNEDRLITDTTAPGADSATARFTRSALTAAQLDWLAALPPERTLGDLFYLCHGAPGADETYLLRRVTRSGVRLCDAREVGARLGATAASPGPPRTSVILCGHDHLQHDLRLPDGRRVVNPGSVGLPAYRDDRPYPHAMAAGSPEARYTILSRSDRNWRVEPIRVDYAHEAAARAARANGRDDWAEWIRTGRA